MPCSIPIIIWTWKVVLDKYMCLGWHTPVSVFLKHWYFFWTLWKFSYIVHIFTGWNIVYSIKPCSIKGDLPKHISLARLHFNLFFGEKSFWTPILLLKRLNIRMVRSRLHKPCSGFEFDALHSQLMLTFWTTVIMLIPLEESRDPC